MRYLNKYHYASAACFGLSAFAASLLVMAGLETQAALQRVKQQS